MAAKDLNKCARLLSNMLEKEPVLDTKEKRKVAQGKQGKGKIVSTAKPRFSKDRKTGKNKKPVKAQHDLLKTKTPNNENKEIKQKVKKRNTGNSSNGCGSETSSSSYEYFRQFKLGGPEPLNDTDQVQIHHPPKPENILRPAENVAETKPPFNTRLISSTPDMSPVSFRAVGQSNPTRVPAFQPASAVSRTYAPSERFNPTYSLTQDYRSAFQPAYPEGRWQVGGDAVGASAGVCSSHFTSLGMEHLKPYQLSSFQIPTRDTSDRVLQLSRKAINKHYGLSENNSIPTSLLTKFNEEYNGSLYGLETGPLPQLEDPYLENVPTKDYNASDKGKHVQFSESTKLSPSTAATKSDFGVQVSRTLGEQDSLGIPTAVQKVQLQDTACNTSKQETETHDRAVNTSKFDKSDVSSNAQNDPERSRNSEKSDMTPCAAKTEETTVSSAVETKTAEAQGETLTERDIVTRRGDMLLFADPDSKQHIQTLQHLLKELREATSGDGESSRLLAEIENEFQSLVPGTAKSLHWQTELNMALQPMRAENAQLRRRLRILNHQLQEKEKLQQSLISSSSNDFNVVHLQLLNHSLEQQLEEERASKTRLQGELQALRTELQAIAKEKHQMLSVLASKDTDHMKSHQDHLTEARQLRVQLAHLETDRLGLQRKLEGQEQLARLALTEKDQRIDRLQQLVRSLHQSMTKLVEDLESVRPQPQSPWLPTMDNLSKIKQLLNESQLDRNDLQTELEGPLPTRPYRPQATDYSAGSGSLSTPTKVSTGQGQVLDGNVARSGVAEASFADKVTAAFSSIPKPVVDSSGSQTSVLTQEMLRHHDCQYPAITKNSLQQQYQNFAADMQEAQYENEHTYRGSVSASHEKSAHAAGSQADSLLLEQEIEQISPQGLAADHSASQKNSSQRYEDSYAETDYLCPPGVSSPLRKVRNGLKVDSANGPTVRDLLSSLAARWQRSASGEAVGPFVSSPVKPGTDQEGKVDDFAQSWPPRANTSHRNEGALNDTTPSVDQSRYSVTDYFKKYHQSTHISKNASLQDPTRSMISSTTREDSQLGKQDSQLVRTSTLKEEDQENGADIVPNADLEISLSTICESASQASDNTLTSVTTTGTIDEQAFWEGLNRLDENIARVQQSLKQNLSS